MSALLIIPLLLPLVTAIAGLLFRHRPGWQGPISVGGSILHFASALWLLAVVDRFDILALSVGNWPAPFGIALVADRFAAIMVAVSAFMGLGVGIYALADVSALATRRAFFPLFQFLLLGVSGAFLTGDIFNLYVWFEVMLIASFVLVVLEGGRDPIEGGLKYVLLNLLASALFLAGAGILYGKLGTLNMADIAARLAGQPDADLLQSTGVLIFAAFGVKAGLFPLFFWLPAAYHTPAVSVSAIFAGLLTKVGVYALFRAYTLFFAAHFTEMQDILLWVAGATMVVGVLGATAHFHIRKILSFHIVSQIGYMILGLALMTPLALAAAIFYLVHHIVVKTNLFLAGGLVGRHLGTEALAHAGGIWKSLPWLALLFAVPAASLAGIPPLSGFWAKLGIVKAGLESEAWLMVALSLGVGLFTLFSMTKIWAEAFWKARPAESPPQPTATAMPPLHSFPFVFPIAVFALVTLALGLAGAPLFALAERAAHDLLNPSLYLDAVLPPKVLP